MKKRGVLSLFFSPVVTHSQKRAMGFLCDACKRPSRAPVLLLACYLCTVWIPSLKALCNVVASLLNLLSVAFSVTLHSTFLCQLAYLFWERSMFFFLLLLWWPSLLCVTMCDKRSSFFNVTVRAKKPVTRCVGTCRCVIESRYVSTLPLYFCVLSLHSSGGAFLEEKKECQSVLKREQEFHFVALLPGIVFPLHFSNLPVRPFVFACIMPPVLPLQCHSLGTRWGEEWFFAHSRR